MLRRYSFLILLTWMLSLLGWWTQSLKGSSEAHRRGVASLQASKTDPEIPIEETPLEASTGKSSVTHRRELIEALDRLVAYQHYYHSVYGHYTKMLHRIGFEIPSNVAGTYEIRVAEASVDHLLVTAFSEEGGRVSDRVSIDQGYRLQANFPVPPPRPEYLRARTQKHLRLLVEAPLGQVIEEEGVYRGYFEFGAQTDSENRRVVFAIGIRPPVLGLQLEMGSGSSNEVAIEDLDLDGVDSRKTGQKAQGNIASEHSQEAFLAQQIFRGEVGRYAKTLKELSQITNFRFPALRDSMEQDPLPGFAPELGPSGEKLEIEPIH